MALINTGQWSISCKHFCLVFLWAESFDTIAKYTWHTLYHFIDKKNMIILGKRSGEKKAEKDEATSSWGNLLPLKKNRFIERCLTIGVSCVNCRSEASLSPRFSIFEWDSSCDDYERQFLQLSLFWSHSRSFDFSAYLLTSPRLNGMQRNRYRKRKKENKAAKERIAWTAVYRNGKVWKISE